MHLRMQPPDALMSRNSSVEQSRSLGLQGILTAQRFEQATATALVCEHSLTG
jgi:hypothetical protein